VYRKRRRHSWIQADPVGEWLLFDVLFLAYLRLAHAPGSSYKSDVVCLGLPVMKATAPAGPTRIPAFISLDLSASSSFPAPWARPSHFSSVLHSRVAILRLIAPLLRSLLCADRGQNSCPPITSCRPQIFEPPQTSLHGKFQPSSFHCDRKAATMVRISTPLHSSMVNF
jgi:hypothetical protein